MSLLIQEISKFLNKHSLWLNPVSAITAGTTGAFINYEFSGQFAKLHPIQIAVLQSIIDNLWWVTIIASAVFLVVAINDGFAKNTIDRLEKKLEKEQECNDLIGQNVKDLFDGFLFRLSNTLGFGVNATNCERITLYIHDSKNKRFIPCGRFSQNAKYSQPGRIEYPEEEGCIGEAWQHGWHFTTLSPNPSIRVNEHQQMYRIKKAVSSKLKMPSVQYAAMRVSSNDGKNYGVLVVESTEDNRFAEKNLRNSLEEQKHFLSELIPRLRQYIPQPEHAKKRGF